LGGRAIALTTEAVESVVLSHLQDQQSELAAVDSEASALIGEIVAEEQVHHDISAHRLGAKRKLDGILRPIITSATEAVIWTGMRAP
jgi:ubiquinone biosynthesis monooxygenase Coq7